MSGRVLGKMSKRWLSSQDTQCSWGARGLVADIREEEDAGDDDSSANVLLWRKEHHWSRDLQK